MQRYIKVVIFSFIVIIFGSGCYTIFQHPAEEKNYSTTNGETDCIRCHPHYHDNFGSTHYYYPDYWATYDQFGRYYAEPWWWDYYWYDNTVQDYIEDDLANPRPPVGERVTRPTDNNTGSHNITTINRRPTGTSSSSGSTTTKQVGENDKTSTSGKSSTEGEVKTKEPTKDKDATKKSGRMKKQ